MMIKLYALEVMEGNIKWSEIKFSPIIKDRIKAYIRKLVEDDEVFNELTKEDWLYLLSQIPSLLEADNKAPTDN